MAPLLSTMSPTFYAAAQLLLITVAVAALSVLWISPEDEDDVMASIDQKADEKDIDHFLGAVSKQYTLLMTTAISYNRKFLYLRPSCGVNNSALKLFDL